MTAAGTARAAPPAEAPAAAAAARAAVLETPVLSAAFGAALRSGRYGRQAEPFHLLGALLGRERLPARELHLPVHRVDRDDLHLHLVAELDDVRRLADAPRRALARRDKPAG